MVRRTPILAPVLLALALLATVAACGSGPAITTPDAATAVGMIPGRVVIDVRTPEEYSAGHLAGAINIDVEGATFEQQIAALGKDAPSFVYCRSGRRSAIAAEAMARAGFRDVVDGGGLDDLVAAGAQLGD
jgi:rhodanese-related sulfurtransferase